jgi:predicted phage terminase large subunit-like protein
MVSSIEEAAAFFSMSILENQYIPHTPAITSEGRSPQTEFLLFMGEEALYGGAAGGGKSDALLMAALQFVHVPGYSAILFRRTYADLSLPSALMTRSHEWLQGTDAHWSPTDKRWTFPSGASLTFGYLEHENHKYRYQSAEFQFIGFDELTQFSEAQYLYLFSRLRRPRSLDVPLRIRAASNPGGVGHSWVKSRFIGEGNAEALVADSYFPSTVFDNPYLDQDNYVRSLSHLDSITKAQLLSGDWTVKQGGEMFQRDWFTVEVHRPQCSRLVRYWDLASTRPNTNNRDPDYAVGCLMGVREGKYYILDVQRLRGTPGDVEARVRQIANIDGRGVSIYIEQEPGSSGVSLISHYVRNVLPGWPVYGDKVTGPKVERAKPVSAQAQVGNVIIINGSWVYDFLDEIESFPNSGVHDDQVDAMSGAFNKISRGGFVVYDDR